MDEGEEVPGRLLVACRHSATLLDSVEEPLDLIASAVELKELLSQIESAERVGIDARASAGARVRDRQQARRANW